MVEGIYQVDNMDSTQHHELFLPGQIVGELILSKLKDCLSNMQLSVYKALKSSDLEKLIMNGMEGCLF